MPSFSDFSLVLPAKPENISCIFYFDKNMNCTWSPQEKIGDTNYTVRLTYSFGKLSFIKQVTNASCSFSRSYIIHPDICTVEVEAQNRDGSTKSDITSWNLDHIVKTEPPIILSVNPISLQMFQIWWKPREKIPIDPLRCTLRFRAVNSAHWKEVSFEDYNKVYNLTGLQVFTEYVIALRFRTNESRFWSNWSQEKNGVTMEEGKPLSAIPLPHILDLWRVVGPAGVEGTRKVVLLWKKAKGAPILERTLGYNIQYFAENSINLTEINNVTNQQYELLLTGQTHYVSVTSFNFLGQSQEAILRIPAAHEETIQCIRDMQAHLAEPLLVVEWESSIPEVDSWMVEWLPETAESEFSALSWESVSHVTNWTIEQVPSEGPRTRVENIGLKTATVVWEEIPKNRRMGFINNYTIFCQAEGEEEFSTTVNSQVLQYDLESLTRRTSYTVWVVANTGAGGTTGKTINFRTSSISPTPRASDSEFWDKIRNLDFDYLVILVLMLGTCFGDHYVEALMRKSSPKESDNPGSTEDRIRKPCSIPADLIDKLVVNFENFLEVLSAEEARKGQESILGGEANEYVTSPSRPDCPPGGSFKRPPGNTHNQCLGMTEETYTEFIEQLLSSGQSPGPEPLSEERPPNPYLKNSVTTREFLVHGNIPEHTKREI
ncbi:Interleukin-31 receptor subunit alpha [Microtus ochrogaster]|uniref:Interleukin-31 receptor subunit alpha n=1 Tax=Microtus ochrogaster TaxID=79684 RepID=A0A8J6G1B0_MICOH|nr:Interleukin-31 receptor subunit alpha [Microtus ochrogaster]